MKKQHLIVLLTFMLYTVKAQELFVMTEPASNMAAKSIGIRNMNWLMKDTKDNGINFHTMPEIMVGINKSWMIHGIGFISNRNNSLVTEGGGIYIKNRFLSADKVHSHFRMAAFGRYSFNNSDIHQEEIETMGHNSGYELGVIATQLIHKVAISTSVSFEKALDNKQYKFPSNQSSSAINYTLSFGKLMLPKEYKDYKQTNLNFMVEMLAQTLTNNGKTYVDLIPSVQLIINSVARIDVGYRKQLINNMVRTAPEGVIIKLEYNFFNVF